MYVIISSFLFINKEVLSKYTKCDITSLFSHVIHHPVLLETEKDQYP